VHGVGDRGMPLESLPNCRDFERRLDLFLDGELDGRSLRDLALHVARCGACEAEVRRAERLQGALGTAVAAEVDRVDVAALWRAIEGGLEVGPLPLAARLRERWRSRSGIEVRFLATAAAVALVLLAVFAGVRNEPLPPTRGKLASNRAHIDSLSSSARSVAVWTEPAQETTAIWVSYER
jgi:anti-sigma factor RsiW